MGAFGRKGSRAIIIAAIGLILAEAMAEEKPPDALGQYLSRLLRVGNRYTDCGTVSIEGGRRTAVHKCVLESIAAKKSFVARFDHQGYETMVSDALVGSSSGDLVVVHFDPWGCKAVECLQVDPCRSPKMTVAGKVLRVSCKNDYEL